jgi:hypothetical protein
MQLCDNLTSRPLHRHWCGEKSVADEADRAAFRTALSEQLHTLTGIKPTVWQQDNAGVKKWVCT